MKIIILLSVSLAVTLAVPAATSERLSGKQREKKSPPSYGGAVGANAGGYQIQPCSAPAPIALYLAPQAAPSLHYRAGNEDTMERSWDAHARAYGGYDGSAGLPGLDAASPLSGSAMGPAIGMFPHANHGGCAVPLLLSCSPKVISGQLIKSHSAGYAAPSYRSNEANPEPHKADVKESDNEKENSEKSAQWTDERTLGLGSGSLHSHFPHMSSMSGIGHPLLPMGYPHTHPLLPFHESTQLSHE